MVRGVIKKGVASRLALRVSVFVVRAALLLFDIIASNPYIPHPREEGKGQTETSTMYWVASS